MLIIKLADRLHNMRTLDARSPASRARIARATHDVLVPLCDRLGIQALKRDLEDVVLFHLEPEAVRAASTTTSSSRAGLERVPRRRRRHGARRRCAGARSTAKVGPAPAALLLDLEGHRRPAATASPFDLPRIVVVVDGPETDCYAALGVIHGQWRPVAGRFKDFIASPEEQPLPLAAHHRDRPRRPDGRGADPHRRRCTAPPSTASPPTSATPSRPTATRPPAADQLAWLHRVLDWEQETTDAAQFLAVAALRPGRGADPGLRRRAAPCCCRTRPPRSTWPTS